MKARVKATGEIVEVGIDYNQDADYIAPNGQLYWQRELDFINLNIKVMREETMIEAINDIDSIRCMVEDIHEEITNTPDYWTRLEHQYAGMAMQGYIIAAHLSHFSFCENDMKDCVSMAHALVEKARYEENPKELEWLKKELEALKIEKTILENKIKLLTEERK